MEFSDRVKRRMKKLGITAVELAETVGVSKGAVTHWTNGTNEAGGKRLVALAEALQCTALWLSSGMGDEEIGGDESPTDSPSERDYALIPQYSARGSSGKGYLNDHVEIKGGLAFKRDWLKGMSLREENLRVMYNHGDSNWPTLSDEEVLLVDVSKIEPVNGKMYAMYDPDNEVIIKRLIRDMSGGWIIRSDNQDKTRYPDMPISDDGMRGVEIIGRVVWRGGGI
ncbi:helix-turn-helix domain-containing protein [Pseudomonas sp. I2]|uniref:helix-turn-helix domain-containing protein n=1 Tax=Pseudomonas sp. I2 TaxID=1338438 RepID=UPI0034D6D57A